MVAWFTVVLVADCSFLVVAPFRNKEKYLSGCSIQFDSDTYITHATRVTTLWLKHFFSVWGVHAML